MKILYDEKLCVRCLACLSEAERGGVTFTDGQLRFDTTKPEDWENLAAICPVGAIVLQSARRCFDWKERSYTF